MSVKANKSAARVLEVLEMIARYPRSGVSELARLLDADKSAVQRAIVTLAESGWIIVATGSQTRWELSAHILTVAYMGSGSKEWLQQSWNVMDRLRNETGETVLIAVPDVRQFVVLYVAESRQMLRTSASIGAITPTRDSATSRAILPYMPLPTQIEFLGGEPDDELREAFRATRKQGYAVSANLFSGATNIAAPVFEQDGRPVGALVVSAPSERLTADHYKRVGGMVAAAARSLSRGEPGASPPN